MPDGRRFEQLLDDRPELASALEAVLEVDREIDQWTFDDVPLDSGTFGELASTELIEKHGDGYSIADRDAVERIVSGDTGTDEMSASNRSLSASLSLDQVDLPLVGTAFAALAFLLAFRLFSWSAVFRDGVVVLSGNDPYYYRYLVEQLLTTGPFDLSVLSSLPQTVTNGEPLLVVTLSWATSLVGGTPADAGFVLALYPVISAVITGGVVYLVTERVSGDRRAALAAIFILSILPAHAYRTSLGYADHHAFDYIWLSLTMLLLVVSTTRRGLAPGRTAAFASSLGIVVALQSLAWDASPVLLAPIGPFLVLKTAMDVRDGREPLKANAEIVGGLAVGTTLVVLVHTGLNWHTTKVSAAPGLLFLGSVGVVGLGEGVRRFDRSLREYGLGLAAGFVLSTGSALLLFPAFVTNALDSAGVLFSQGAIVETQSLFAAGSLPWLLVLGPPLVTTVAYTLYEIKRVHDGHAPSAVTATYAVYFLLLSVLQIRFVGEYALVAATLSGMAFVHLTSWLDISNPPAWLSATMEGDAWSPSRLDWSALSAVAFLLLLVGGLGMIQTPIKTSQLTIDDGAYRTADQIATYDETRDDPHTDYVLSPWGENRMYNYFVNGQSQSYAFARDTYRPFMTTASNESGGYQMLSGRVEYIVSTGRWQPDTIGARLQEAYGGQRDTAPALDHYRAFYESPDGQYIAYEVVDGAVVTGSGRPNSVLNASVHPPVGEDSATYRKNVRVNDHGVYETVVPYTGTYQIGGRPVTVSESAVQNGTYLSAFDGPGMAAWSFDEGNGSTAYDRSGGYHFEMANASWTEGVNDTGVRFGRENGYVQTSRFKGPSDDFTIRFWIRPRSTVRETNNVIVRTSTSLPVILRPNGRISFRIPGMSEEFLLAEAVQDGEWSSVTLTYDGTTKRAYVNGELVGTQHVETTTDIPKFGRRLAVGGGFYTAESSFTGGIDEMRIYDRALSNETVAHLADRNESAAGN